MLIAIRRAALALAGLISMAAAGPAAAHPHVFVDARAEIVFDKAGEVTAVRHIWQFDEAFTAFAIQGLDANNDGKLSDDELAPLAKVNVDSLKEYEFFTWLRLGGKKFPFVPPSEYWLEFHGGRLTLFYALAAEDAGGDPRQGDARGVRPGIFRRLHVSEGSGSDVDRRAGRVLGSIPSAARARRQHHGEARCDPAGSARFAAGIAGCRRRPRQSRHPELPVTARRSAVVLSIAALLMVATLGGLHAASPFGIATPDSPGGAGFGGPLGPLFVQVAYYQSEFYKGLIHALTDIKQDGWAVWLLLALSFAYGVFHAAGPGHGKAVISAYLISSGETVRRGIALSFFAAFVQAISAILIVGVAAMILHVTAVTMTAATDWFEIFSYALVAVVGGWLLWTKTFGGGHHHHHHHHHHVGVDDDHGAHDHDHHHGHDAEDAHHHEHDDHRAALQQLHAAEPVTLGAALARAWSTILAVGVRPCSGAIIVLVFALSQGLFLAGVAATFVMALGTGLTVASLAALAVSARGVAVHLAGTDSPAAARLVRIAEIGAAAAVLLLGLVLLGGALAHGLPG